MKQFWARNRDFLIGITIGVASGMVFSKLILDADQYGSKADWVAALGTWAIGLAATYVAMESRKQTIQADASRRFARQSQFLYSLTHATILGGAADSFLDAEAHDRTWTDYDELLDALGTYAQDVPVTSDIVEHVPHEVIAEMVVVNEMLRIVRRDLLKERGRVARFATQEAVIPEEELSNFDEIRGRLRDITTRSKNVIEMIENRLA
ncbi:hypothetical protein [Stenotrophomonas geniculata]|uniref:hypothetical protein n=1 Tax=Stenotrophomonas geniculata TaxID=86188 RepID=UPI0039C6ECD9